jgi:hypothetical protein
VVLVQERAKEKREREDIRFLCKIQARLIYSRDVNVNKNVQTLLSFATDTGLGWFGLSALLCILLQTKRAGNTHPSNFHFTLGIFSYF